MNRPRLHLRLLKRNHSRRCLRLSPLEAGGTSALCALTGLGETGWQRIAAARGAGPFTSLRDVCLRTQLPKAILYDLIRAGACDELVPRNRGFGKRRESLWEELGRMDYDPGELPADAA